MAWASKYLPVSNGSSITLTSGSADTKPAKGWSVISYFAGGLVSLARGLAVDLAPIRVNVVRAGIVDTGLWGYMSDEANRLTSKRPRLDIIVLVIPQQRRLMRRRRGLGPRLSRDRNSSSSR